VDVNGINNLTAEMYYCLYHKVYGMNTVSLRLTNTYGPRMDLKSDTKGFVGIFVRKALRGETVKIYGTGKQLRDFNYVDDVVDALILAVATGDAAGKALNIGHPEPKSLLEFVNTLQMFAEFPYELVPFPPEIGIIDIGDYYSDFHRFHELTGWNPQVDLAAGLEKTVTYYREMGDFVA
jgi:nucleoside-diphosphate-sugar epimerase